MNSNISDDNQVTSSDSLKVKRHKLFQKLLLIIVSLTIIYAIYWFFYGSRYVTTDNAYVGAEIAEVTALVDGVVQNINVTDTQNVKQGDILVVIDDRDAKLALKRAEANYTKAETDLKCTEVNYNRRRSLAKVGSISAEELTNAENAYRVAQAALEEAAASKEIAELALARTKIYAPISGVVALRQVQLGQRVTFGMKLLSIVPTKDIYVNANFKENELREIKAGQAVTLTADKYGSSVKFYGKVEGFSGGTGSAFAIIPAQNATGNWIKVVQRLPVRIAINNEELEKNPLEVGLSMFVKIDISKRD